ncbi:MAG: DUF4249 domain-containing protein [Bacteroidales bacterium]|jgi:hypothetical protein|nr:DUF4249 domain-containing protein [Bacteroidales bacterium]
MIKIRISLFLILAVFQLCSCSDDFTNDSGTESRIIVDGYIEVGKKARVVLTQAIPVESQIDSTKYLDIVSTRANVRISDGEQSEYLYLRWNKNAFPQHYYESEKIRGEEGKTYDLEIMYYGDTLTAQTTIPEPVNVDSVWTIISEQDSSERDVWFRLCDNPQQKNYYRTFTRIISEQHEYVSTYLSSFDDNSFNGVCEEKPIYKGNENFYDKSRDFSFAVHDTVLLKLVSMDEDAYLFWKNYEKEVFNLGNPFASNGSNLISNISGGYGIWCGYNQSIHTIIIK